MREGIENDLKELLSIMKDSKDKVRLRQTTSKRWSIHGHILIYGT